MKDRSFAKTWICSTFSTDANRLVDIELNQKLSSVLNTQTKVFGNDTSSFVDLLKSDDLCKYQGRLIRRYLEKPDQYLKLDCDCLTFTIDCSKADIAKLIKPIGKHQRYRVCKITDEMKAASFGVRSYWESWINNNWIKNKPGNKQVIPYYSHHLEFSIGNDKRKTLRLFIADGLHNSNGRCAIRIYFIPDAFTDIELSLFFNHLKSRLHTHRYDQLIRRAKLKRVDFGFLLPGVLSTFFYAYRDITKSLDSVCFPEQREHIKETTYLGDRLNSSHIIVYEKLLKEAKKYPEVMQHIDMLAVTTRCEYRFYPDRNNVQLKLTELKNTPARLAELKVLDPTYLMLMPEEVLSEMLTDKTQNNLRLKRRTVWQTLRKDNKTLKYFKLNEEWLVQEQERLAQHYLNLIIC